jgi:hypothetical protein
MSPHIVGYFAVNAHQLPELLQMPPRQRERVLDKIEARLEDALRRPASRPQQPQRRSIPQISRPQGAPLRGGGAAPPRDLGNMSMDEYVRHRGFNKR